MSALGRGWIRSVLVVGLSAIMTLSGIWAAADARLLELRFALSSRPPSNDIVFVDIDSTSLAAIGVWPWPRSIHATLLDQLMAMGAYEVAFDIDFSSSSSRPDLDAEFADALERAGGYAYLAAFQQSQDEGVTLTQPLPMFAAHAEPVLVNVQADTSGIVRAVSGGLLRPPLRSLAATLSGHPETGTASLVDFSIDLSLVPRIPAIDVIGGSVDPQLVRDKQVVIGASAIELRDLFTVPRFGTVPGPLLQIAAAETLKADRALTSTGPWLALLVSALVVALLVTLAPLGLLGAVVACAAAALAAETIGWALLATAAVSAPTMPFHGTLALAILARAFGELLDRRRQVRAHQQRLDYLANHDPSTGALSRVALIDTIAQAQQGGHSPWLLIVRLERLRAAGASLGHDLAEGAIRQAYDRMRSADLGQVCRIETDAFALLRAAPLQASEHDALIALLDTPCIVQGHRIALTARWGASGLIERPAPPEEYVRRAQVALSFAMQEAAKGHVYTSRFDSMMQERQSMDVALRNAVANGELDIVFQPQMGMARRAAYGFEALVRWNSPSLGQVSPAVFIPLAEENGSIVAIGAWVMREACRRAMQQGWAGRLSVNVSAVQFDHGDLAAMIADALNDTGFPAGRLVVEITESLFMGSASAISETLQRLRAIGVTIAIDDFGTGFSSLSYLSRLPVDVIKIDQSFVRALPDTRSAAVIEGIVSLARRLELKVVAEGVETEDQFEFLSAIGCDVAQGYLFGQPSQLPRPAARTAAA